MSKFVCDIPVALIIFKRKDTVMRIIDRIAEVTPSKIYLLSDNGRNEEERKLVESISCGTAVLTTNISNVKDYVHDGTNGYIVNIDSLKDDMVQAIKNKSCVTVNSDEFDYHTHMEVIRTFLES